MKTGRAGLKIADLARTLLKKQAPAPANGAAVLYLSDLDADRLALERLLGDTRWKLLPVRSCAEALQLLESGAAPIVLCDRDLCGVEWRQSLELLLSAPKPVCVILVSRVADVYLWEEVVRMGGFDVLPKPFQKDHVVRTLNFAWNHWKAVRI